MARRGSTVAGKAKQVVTASGNTVTLMGHPGAKLEGAFTLYDAQGNSADERERLTNSRRSAFKDIGFDTEYSFLQARGSSYAPKGERSFERVLQVSQPGAVSGYELALLALSDASPRVVGVVYNGFNLYILACHMQIHSYRQDYLPGLENRKNPAQIKYQRSAHLDRLLTVQGASRDVFLEIRDRVLWHSFQSAINTIDALGRAM